jgi:prolyl-tRNA synthetase
VLKQRDGQKKTQPADGLLEAVRGILDTMQADLLSQARKRMADNTVLASSFDEVAAHLSSATAEKGGGKFVAVHVKDDPACDAKFKEIKASVRCIPLKDEFDGAGTCIITGERVAQRVIVAKAY